MALPLNTDHLTLSILVIVFTAATNGAHRASTGAMAVAELILISRGCAMLRLPYCSIVIHVVLGRSTSRRVLLPILLLILLAVIRESLLVLILLLLLLLLHD